MAYFGPPEIPMVNQLLCGMTTIANNCAQRLSNAVGDATKSHEKQVTNAVHATCDAVSKSDYAGMREQILANASVLFPIYLPSKIDLISKHHRSPSLPPLHLIVLHGEDGFFRAMVLYGAPTSPEKAHFLISGQSKDPAAALHRLLRLTTKLLGEQAGCYFSPAPELQLVTLSDNEGGYVREPDGAKRAEHAFWWGADTIENPEWIKNIELMGREVEAMGSGYYSESEANA